MTPRACKRYILCLCILCCICFSVSAQDLIKGIVVDSATFTPLPNVNIYVKHKLRGTTTDINGNFSLSASPADTLILSLVGYERLEMPLFDYEASMIRLAQKSTLLKPIIINDARLDDNIYEGMFDEQNEKLKQSIPFYYSRIKKDKIRASRWRDETLRVQTYVDVVINNPETKNELMRKYKLTEKDYYDLLTRFNEKHYQVMYYLTAGELLSLLNTFYEANAHR